MSYRLKRKRFNCENCVREWNQLVGQDVENTTCKQPSRELTLFFRRLVLQISESDPSRRAHEEARRAENQPCSGCLNSQASGVIIESVQCQFAAGILK